MVSKSRTVELATVILPVAGSIANAPLALPPVIVQVSVVPASGSLAATVPTFSPVPRFSAT